MQRVPGYESDRSVLALYDRASGTSRVVTEGLDNWVKAFRFAPDGRRLYFTADVKGRTPLHALDLATGKISVVSNVGLVDAFEVSPDGTWAVVARRQMHRPTELHRVALAGAGTESALTSQNQALLDEVDVRPMEEVFVDSPSGKKIQVLLVKPHGFDPAKKYPAIVNVHGGPQMQWADAFRGDAQVYPGAGYVVAFPNPHGSTGWGQDFTAAISKDWDGKVMQDVTAVSDWLAAQPWVDKDRMGAMGWSWGGYAMMWLAGHTDRYKAIASMMGVYDLRSMYSSTEELWFPEWDLGGTPWQNPEGYRKQSPSSYVTQFKTPTLVVTGPEGLPRALHPVALLLHRPAEDGRPLAPRGVRGLRALAGVVRHGPVLRRPPRLVPHVPRRRALAVGPEGAGEERRLRREGREGEAVAYSNCTTRSATPTFGGGIGGTLTGRLRASLTSARTPAEKPVTSVHS